MYVCVLGRGEGKGTGKGGGGAVLSTRHKKNIKKIIKALYRRTIQITPADVSSSISYFGNKLEQRRHRDDGETRRNFTTGHEYSSGDI